MLGDRIGSDLVIGPNPLFFLVFSHFSQFRLKAPHQSTIQVEHRECIVTATAVASPHTQRRYKACLWMDFTFQRAVI